MDQLAGRLERLGQRLRALTNWMISTRVELDRLSVEQLAGLEGLLFENEFRDLAKEITRWGALFPRRLKETDHD